jgi:hypothetical protein
MHLSLRTSDERWSVDTELQVWRRHCHLPKRVFQRQSVQRSEEQRSFSYITHVVVEYIALALPFSNDAAAAEVDANRNAFRQTVGCEVMERGNFVAAELMHNTVKFSLAGCLIFLECLSVDDDDDCTVRGLTQVRLVAFTSRNSWLTDPRKPQTSVTRCCIEKYRRIKPTSYRRRRTWRR